MIPAPNPRISFSQSPDWRQQTEAARQAREDRMRNALEILAGELPSSNEATLLLRRFVRATAREGLGRE